MDVRNSRGKFDEIKEKFAINPDPIASQSSLNAINHDELEIFLKILLIPSRTDQKFKNKRIYFFVVGLINRLIKEERNVLRLTHKP